MNMIRLQLTKRGDKMITYNYVARADEEVIFVFSIFAFLTLSKT